MNISLAATSIYNILAEQAPDILNIKDAKQKDIFFQAMRKALIEVDKKMSLNQIDIDKICKSSTYEVQEIQESNKLIASMIIYDTLTNQIPELLNIKTEQQKNVFLQLIIEVLGQSEINKLVFIFN